MSAGSSRPRGRALTVAVVACYAVAACGSSTPSAGGPSNSPAGSGSPDTICASLADFGKAVQSTSQQVDQTPAKAEAAVHDLDKQFHSLQQDLQKRAPGLAGTLDHAMTKLDQQLTKAGSNQDMQQVARTVSQHLSTVSDAVSRVEGKIGC